MKFSHAVVWLDHQRAHVIHFNADSSEAKEVKHKGGPNHLPHKHGAVGSGHAAEDPAYYHAVAADLKGTAEVLVLGPAAAKNEFIKHIQSHDKAVASAVVGVENADHPSEGQILAHARQWFEKTDRTIDRKDMPLKGM